MINLRKKRSNANRKIFAHPKHNQLYCYGLELDGIYMLSILQTLNFPNLKFDTANRPEPGGLLSHTSSSATAREVQKLLTWRKLTLCRARSQVSKYQRPICLT